MSFVPHTPENIKDMIKDIGVSSLNDLFNDIPDSIKQNVTCNLPEPLSELSLYNDLKKTASSNYTLKSFLGGGAYNHYIPSIVDHLSSRSEFYTAYTPYQPEVSQGTLTAIFEFQTIMCSLTGMDVANASMYDGATSLAEAVLMSVRSNNRKKAIVSRGVNPLYRNVLKTYSWANSLEIIERDTTEGSTLPDIISSGADDSVSCIVIQSPNFFGIIEDIAAIKESITDNKINLIVVVTEPLSLALLKSPGHLGADIVCGDAQSFGNPMGFGGPMLGFLTARDAFIRRMPGRLVGKSTDLDGKEAYVLTLQTREQHIRRERATSNICSNQGLCLLRSVIYLAYYGDHLRDLAVLNHSRASYFYNRLQDKGFSCFSNKPFFNEFVVQFNNARSLHNRIIENGYVPGLLLGDYYKELEDCILFCVTELNTKEDIDAILDVMENISY